MWLVRSPYEDSPASAPVLSAHKFPIIPHKRTRPSREPHGGCHWRPEQSQQGAALASKVGAIIRPSAFAALTSANLVGRCTGRSAGLAPFRKRSTHLASPTKASAGSTPYERRRPMVSIIVRMPTVNDVSDHVNRVRVRSSPGIASCGRGYGRLLSPPA